MRRLRRWTSWPVSFTIQAALCLFFLLFGVTAVFDYVMLDRALFIGELHLKEVTENWALYAPYTKAMCIAQRQLSAVLHSSGAAIVFGAFFIFYRRHVRLARKALALAERHREP